jgi:hypothetical protein
MIMGFNVIVPLFKKVVNAPDLSSPFEERQSIPLERL